MKTAISVNDELLQHADEAAHDMGVSRSRLFSIAVEDYLHHRRQQATTEQLNRVYDGSPDPMAPKIKKAMRKVIRDRW